MAEDRIRRYLSHREVAAEIGINPERFYRIKRKLERERGFPSPVPEMGYDPLAIKLWQDGELVRLGIAPAPAAGEAAPEAASDEPAPEDVGDEWAGVLDRRAGALAERS